MKPDPTREKLKTLGQLRGSSPDAAGLSLLRTSLADRSGLVVAEAARIARELDQQILVPDLLTAFDRLFNNAVKRDPKCQGKTGILKALTGLDHTESPPYVRGSRHVQMEPVWGGADDTAALLRGTSILGLVTCTDLGRGQILKHLVDALADVAHTVRTDAVRGLEQMNGDDVILLLRLKARLGDDHAPVVGQAFDAILRLEPDEGVSFVSDYLNSDEPGIRDEGVLALGGAPNPAAVAKLIEAWNARTDRDFRGVILRALSASREESAVEFLLDIVRVGLTRDADLALEALAIHSTSPEMAVRVEDARRTRAEED